MPDRRKQGGKKDDKGHLKDQIENLLSGLGLGGDYSFLIDHAIRKQFSETDFLVKLVHSPSFQRTYPGLIQKGNIAPFLSANPSAFTTGNLGSAISKYNSLANSYKQVLRGYDIDLTPQKIALLIQGQKSPEEFATDINVITTVNQNPGLHSLYNQELKAAGKPGLSEQGLFQFLKGTAPKDFYDIYEAAYLRNAGLNLGGAKGALQTARGLGAPGQQVDLNQLVGDVFRFKNDIQPELDRQGISDTDLALLASGSDTRNLTPVLQQLIAQKRARGTPVAGYQSRRGTGGGPSLYGAEDTQSL
jgi:hypothetical protein